MKPKIIYQWICTPFYEECLPVPRTESGGHVCPVCGLVSEAYREGAWDSDGQTKATNGIDIVGGPSYEICVSCVTQFGLDDMVGSDGTVQTAWRELRQKWLERKGHSAAAYEQLESIPELTQAEKYVKPQGRGRL